MIINRVGMRMLMKLGICLLLMLLEIGSQMSFICVHNSIFVCEMQFGVRSNHRMLVHAVRGGPRANSGGARKNSGGVRKNAGGARTNSGGLRANAGTREGNANAVGNTGESAMHVLPNFATNSEQAAPPIMTH